MAKKSVKKTAAKATKTKKTVKKVSPIPKGLTSVTTMLALKGAAAAIEFYKKAFGAKELSRMGSPDGSNIWHASIRIGDGTFFISDEMPQASMRGPSESNLPTGGLNLYVKDCDATFDNAVKAGAKVIMPVSDQFWGDRSGTIADPAGVPWMISTRKKNMTNAQMKKAGDEFMKNFKPPQP